MTKTELIKKGSKIHSKAPLILMFTTHNQMKIWNLNLIRKILLLKIQNSRGHTKKTKVQVNIYQNAKGSTFNKGNGSAYGHAWSIANLKEVNGYSLTKKMILPTISSTGQVVRHQKFLIK